MKEKDAKAIETLALSMDWDDLTLAILELEMELHELKYYIDEKELEDRIQELQIYEITKENMVKRLSKNQPSFAFIYGYDYVSSENDDDDFY